MKLFKRWREVPEEAEFEVVETPTDPEAASEAASILRALDRNPDRLKPNYPGVPSLDGEWWSVHAANGTVYLAGEDGAVQAQFAPVDAFSLGTLLQQAARE